MPIDIEVSGVDELRSAFVRTSDRLRAECRGASLEAAAAGIREAIATHPYEDQTGDLTDRARAEQRANGDATMVWPKRYASYVDEGTRKNAPYQFTPQAVDKATAVLETETAAAVQAALAEMK